MFLLHWPCGSLCFESFPLDSISLLWLLLLYCYPCFEAKYKSLLEKAMAPHSSTLVWKIPWMEEPGRLQSMGSLRVGHDWATSLSCFGEGNGNPLQCSCLENPRDGGAWWAAVYGVAQSWTRLKRLSSSSSSSSSSINVSSLEWIPSIDFVLPSLLVVYRSYFCWDFRCTCVSP